MNDIPGMSVKEHHALTVGVLALCYRHVPADLKQAIYEGLLSAKQMGMNIKPENVLLCEDLPQQGGIASDN